VPDGIGSHVALRHAALQQREFLRPKKFQEGQTLPTSRDSHFRPRDTRTRHQAAMETPKACNCQRLPALHVSCSGRFRGRSLGSGWNPTLRIYKMEGQTLPTSRDSHFRPRNARTRHQAAMETPQAYNCQQLPAFHVSCSGGFRGGSLGSGWNPTLQ
jgi:hypothetical protein